MFGPDTVTHLLSLGLIGVFLVTTLEKFIPVVPSYVMLLALGMSAPDLPQLTVMLAITVIGSLCGSAGWFAIGRTLGEQRIERIVARFGKYVFFPLPTYLRLAESYRRNRFRVTAFGQTIPVARVYLGLPAGVLKLPALSFLTAATLGILVWNLPFLLLGFLLKGTSHSLFYVGLRASIVLVAAEFLIVVLVRMIRRSRRDSRI
jgi:membrane protein DedA with SNARE-associated domain